MVKCCNGREFASANYITDVWFLNFFPACSQHTNKKRYNSLKVFNFYNIIYTVEQRNLPIAFIDTNISDR